MFVLLELYCNKTHFPFRGVHHNKVNDTTCSIMKIVNPFHMTNYLSKPNTNMFFFCAESETGEKSATILILALESKATHSK